MVRVEYHATGAAPMTNRAVLPGLTDAQLDRVIAAAAPLEPTKRDVLLQRPEVMQHDPAHADPAGCCHQCAAEDTDVRHRPAVAQQT
jgi:hypothetical protein